MNRRSRKQLYAAARAAPQHISRQMFEKTMRQRRVDSLRKLHRRQDLNAQKGGEAMLENESKQNHTSLLLQNQDDDICRALQQMKTKKQAELLEKKRICSESDELKDLAKVLAETRLYRDRLRYQSERAIRLSKDRQQEIQRDLDNIRLAEESEEKRRIERAKRYNDPSKLKAELDEQIRQKREQERAAYDEFVRERNKVDEIVSNMAKERQEEQLKRVKKQQKTRQEIQQFVTARNEYRNAEKRRNEKEDRNIQHYLEVKNAREEKQKQVRRDNIAKQNQILQQIANKIRLQNKKEEEMHNLLMDLYHAELEKKQIDEEKRRAEKSQQMKDDMLRANELQRMLKEKQRTEDERAEREFRNKLLQQLEQDAELERLTQQRQRRERAAYKAEVDKLIKLRRDIQERNKREDTELSKKEKEREEYRKHVIQEEKERLLAEYRRELELLRSEQ